MEARDSFELYNILDDYFKNRLDVNPLDCLTGAVAGKLDGYIFNITYRKDNYLLISTEHDGRFVIDEMLPIFKSVTKREPIIEYNMKTDNQDQEMSMPTLEFDMKDPEGRIRDIINGRAWSQKTVLSNINILYNNNEINNYIESFDTMLEERKNAKIYGIYPGSIKDTKEIDSLDEIDLFLRIEALGAYVYRMNRDIMMGRIDTDISEEEYALEYLVYQTKKFGVELGDPEYGEHIKATSSYKAWYNFYSNHFNYFNHSDFEYFINAKKEGKDVSHYLPTGNWKDNIRKTL